MKSKACSSALNLSLIARIKVLRLLSVAAVALFLFVGTVHADVFVSNFGNGTVTMFDDSGNYIKQFATGLGSTEGISCAKLSNNTLYVADLTDTVYLFDLTTGLPKG